jgi:hypothetical protein
MESGFKSRRGHRSNINWFRVVRLFVLMVGILGVRRFWTGLLRNLSFDQVPQLLTSELPVDLLEHLAVHVPKHLRCKLERHAGCQQARGTGTTQVVRGDVCQLPLLRGLFESITQWAAAIEKRRGKHIATVAVARKLAGVLYALWRDGTRYEPHHACRKGAAAA